MNKKTGVIFLLGMLVVNVAIASEPLKILALGDSTTAGAPGFRSPAENPPSGAGNEQSQYTYWLVKGHPEWTVMNRGISGERTDQIFERFEKYLESESAQEVIVLAGVNDLHQGYSIEAVESNLKKIYELAIQEDMGVVACTILPFDKASTKVKKEIQIVNAWIQNYAEEHGFLFCDTYSVVNNPKNPGNLTGSPDGAHPDLEGYKKIGKAIAQKLVFE